MSMTCIEIARGSARSTEKTIVSQIVEPEIDQWAELDDADRRILTRLLHHSVDYIDHPLFHKRGIAKVLFASMGEVARPAAGSGLGSEVERALFLRYNYARYRQANILRGHGHGPLPAPKLRQLMNWVRRAIEVRNQIVEPNLPLVLAMVRRNRMLNLDYSELISEGSLALLRCVDKFDCARGNKFSTYACRSILKSFARVALRTGRYRAKFPFLFEPALEKGDHGERGHDNAEAVCLEAVRKIMRDNRAVLSDIEMRVIHARFLNDNQTTGGGQQTLEEIGHSIGVTKERVRQIQLKALRKLRVTLEDCLLS